MNRFTKLMVITGFATASFFGASAMAEENINQQVAEMSLQLGVTLEKSSVFQADIISAHSFVETKQVRFATPVRREPFNPVFAGASYETDGARFAYRILPVSLDY